MYLRYPGSYHARTRTTSSEEWALKRYLNMEALEAVENPKPTTFQTLTKVETGG